MFSPDSWLVTNCDSVCTLASGKPASAALSRAVLAGVTPRSVLINVNTFWGFWNRVSNRPCEIVTSPKGDSPLGGIGDPDQAQMEDAAGRSLDLHRRANLQVLGLRVVRR